MSTGTPSSEARLSGDDEAAKTGGGRGRLPSLAPGRVAESLGS
jgi:hypothetical protein